MTEAYQQELDRILGLVEKQRVSPEEGERLIAALEGRRQEMRCPYCAEVIPAGPSVCPECASPLGVVPPAAAAAGRSGAGLPGLSGLGKVLVVYTFAVTLIVILSALLPPWSPAEVVQMAMAALGLASAFLICKGQGTGWGLGMLWAGLQIVEVVMHHEVLNRQVLAFDVRFTSNGAGLGVNAAGILLLVLFAVAARKRDPRPVEEGGDRYVREVKR